MRSLALTLLTAGAALAACAQSAPSTTTDPLASDELGREVAYVVHDVGDGAPRRVVYLTDGEQWLAEGLAATLDSLLGGLSPEPAATRLVYVSAVDPASGANVRQTDFFANPAYYAFFRDRLLPAVEADLPADLSPADRSLVGISFGGLSAAFFSAQPDAPFGHYALLSPVTYPRPEVLEALAFARSGPSRVYLSTGTHDAEAYVDPLAAMYRGLGWPVVEVRTDGAHDYANWRGQLPRLAAWLDAAGSPPADALPDPTAMTFLSTVPAAEYDRNVAYYADQAYPGLTLDEMWASTTAAAEALFADLPEERLGYAYAPGKWTVAEVLQHVISYEYIMAESALVIAGAAPRPLRYQRYTQAGTAAPGRGKSKARLLADYRDARAYAEAAFASLSPAQLVAVGRHEGFRTSARVLAPCISGHQAHHFAVLRQRYLGGDG